MRPNGQTLINFRFATVPSLLLWLRIFRHNFPSMSLRKSVNKTLLNIVNMRVYLQPTALTMKMKILKNHFFQIFETPLCRAMIKSEVLQISFIFVFLTRLCYIFIYVDHKLDLNLYKAMVSAGTEIPNFR